MNNSPKINARGILNNAADLTGPIFLNRNATIGLPSLPPYFRKKKVLCTSRQLAAIHNEKVRYGLNLRPKI